MANALLQIKPHEVSRDLSGYSVLLYGTPKSGKTTIASKFPKALVFAFEKGYSAIPGIMAMPINKWSEFRGFLSDLDEPETKEMYKTIVIDTADIAYDYCTEYILNREGAETMKDIPYGGGYQMVMKEFDKCIRRILQMDYGLVLISHSQDVTLKDQNDNEYQQMMPTLDKRGRLVCERTCDIIGLTRPVTEPDGRVVTKMFMRETPRFVAGSRFRYTPDVIDLSYENLVNAIKDAIDKEAAETGNQYVTATKSNLYIEAEDENFDFTAMNEEFGNLVNQLMAKDIQNRSTITKIVADYLGAGRKVSECTEKDAGQLDLILKELRKLVSK